MERVQVQNAGGTLCYTDPPYSVVPNVTLPPAGCRRGFLWGILSEILCNKGRFDEDLIGFQREVL